MQETELNGLKPILQLYVSNGLQILYNKKITITQIDIKLFISYKILCFHEFTLCLHLLSAA